MRNRILSSSRAFDLAKVALAFFLVYLIFQKIDFRTIPETLSGISTEWLVYGTAAFVMVTVIQALRMWLLLGRKISISKLFHVTVLQNLVTTFVASSAGGITFLAVLKKRYQVTLARGAASILMVKIGEIHALGVVLALSAALTWETIVGLHAPVRLFLSMIFSGMIFFLLMIIFRWSLLQWVAGMMEKLDKNRYPAIETYQSALTELSRSDFIHVVSLFLFVFLFSLGFILSVASAFWFVIRVFNIPLEFEAMLFATAVIQFMALVPVHVFGGLGLFDLTKLYLLGMFFPDSQALASAIIGSRCITYLLQLLISIYSLWMVYRVGILNRFRNHFLTGRD